MVTSEGNNQNENTPCEDKNTAPLAQRKSQVNMGLITKSFSPSNLARVEVNSTPKAQENSPELKVKKAKSSVNNNAMRLNALAPLDQHQSNVVTPKEQSLKRRDVWPTANSAFDNDTVAKRATSLDLMLTENVLVAKRSRRVHEKNNVRSLSKSLKLSRKVRSSLKYPTIDSLYPITSANSVPQSTAILDDSKDVKVHRDEKEDLSSQSKQNNSPLIPKVDCDTTEKRFANETELETLAVTAFGENLLPDKIPCEDQDLKNRTNANPFGQNLHHPSFERATPCTSSSKIVGKHEIENVGQPSMQVSGPLSDWNAGLARAQPSVFIDHEPFDCLSQDIFSQNLFHNVSADCCSERLLSEIEPTLSDKNVSNQRSSCQDGKQAATVYKKCQQFCDDKDEKKTSNSKDQTKNNCAEPDLKQSSNSVTLGFNSSNSDNSNGLPSNGVLTEVDCDEVKNVSLKSTTLPNVVANNPFKTYVPNSLMLDSNIPTSVGVANGVSSNLPSESLPQNGSVLEDVQLSREEKDLSSDSCQCTENITPLMRSTAGNIISAKDAHKEAGDKK